MRYYGIASRAGETMAVSRSPTTMSPDRITSLLAGYLGARSVVSVQPLLGGATNLNLLLRLSGDETPLVLKFYRASSEAQTLELSVLRALGSRLPVPNVIHASRSGGVYKFILYPYVEGATFQELKASGSPTDIASAAYHLGRTLAALQRAAPVDLLALGLKPRQIVSDHALTSSTLAARLGRATISLVQASLYRWQPRLQAMYQSAGLVHGDFNNRNAVFQRTSAGWVVASLLDWERSCVGSPMWDAARFICYEDELQPCREPHFSGGYRDGGGVLPNDWPIFSRVINLISAVESLSQADLQPQFIPGLCELVEASVAY